MKMAKLLKPKDKILLALALLGDFFDEARLLGGVVGSVYKNVYGWTPPQFKRQRFYEVVSRRIKTGEIKKIVKKGQTYLRLLSAGKKRLVRDFPILKLQKQRWDGFWTIVAFDIKEINRYQRDFLRNKLLELGFGMYQRSLYISPYNWVEDLREFIIYHKLRGVRVFRAKEVLIGDPKQQAAKIWKLDRLASEYKRLISKAKRIKRMKGGRKKENKARKLRSQYLDLLLVDPCLPKQLLPDDWPAEEARKLALNL